MLRQWRRLGMGWMLSLPLGLLAQSICIVPDPALSASPIAQNALNDFKALLDSACHCVVEEEGANVRIMLMAPTASADAHTTFSLGRDYPYFHYPEHGFTWQSQARASQTLLTLAAPSPQGIANGLYALLQEKLGFKFVHARQTLYPRLRQWPLAGDWEWTGRPRFDKKGFHLHTMHPLELTQPLHDPDFPGGRELIQEYLRWLARNGQNYFEFSLMEGVDTDLERWASHAAEFTHYAHDRGILCGLDISIHMVQQKSYQIVRFPPKDLRSFKQQVRSRLRTLMQAHWDFINLEFALAEFVGGLEGLRSRLRDAVIAEMAHYPQTKLIGRQHVVKPEDEVGGSHGKESLNVPDDPRMGILVHTVMCYALTDTYVPVYELHDFEHLHQMLMDQNAVRETWYYPESAYWVTFDNSIPLLLLPYLDARYRDIHTCEALGIPGHVTFSSGWEWGYWLMDWSIARWSWDYSAFTSGVPSVGPLQGPYQYLSEIFPGPSSAENVIAIAQLQKEVLIRRNLIRWLCPSNPTDELPPPMNKQFQPRGFVNLGDLGKVYKRSPEKLVDLPIDSLRHYGDQVRGLLQAERSARSSIMDTSQEATRLTGELMDALDITAYRAYHSALLMQVAKMKMPHPEMGKKERSKNVEKLLMEAASTREIALSIVQRQEARYRYPVSLLASRYPSYTAYDFGYLYTVHNLHFWEREERQVLQGRHGPFFMNVYDLAKIAGLKD